MKPNEVTIITNNDYTFYSFSVGKPPTTLTLPPVTPVYLVSTYTFLWVEVWFFLFCFVFFLSFLGRSPVNPFLPSSLFVILYSKSKEMVLLCLESTDICSGSLFVSEGWGFQGTFLFVTLFPWPSFTDLLGFFVRRICLTIHHALCPKVLEVNTRMTLSRPDVHDHHSTPLYHVSYSRSNRLLVYYLD